MMLWEVKDGHIPKKRENRNHEDLSGTFHNIASFVVSFRKCSSPL